MRRPCLFVILTLGACQSPSPTHWRDSSEIVNGLQLGLAVEPSGTGPPRLVIHFRNAGSEFLDIVEPSAVFLEVRQPSGHWRAFQHQGWGRNQSDSVHTFEPGHHEDEHEPISRFTSLTPGTHTVRMSMSVDLEKLKQRKSGRLWSGVVRSNAVEVTIPGTEKGTQSMGTSESESAGRDLAIYEAVFRHQFRSNASGAQSSAPAYFLSIEGKDPPSGFLERFQDNRPPVRPGSEFRRGAGLLFRVEGITEISSSIVNVTGGYYEAELSASGNTYRVELREGLWVVVSDKMDWVS